MDHLQDSVVSTTVLKNETDTSACLFTKAGTILSSVIREYPKQKKCHFFPLGLLRNLTKINYSRSPLSSGVIMYVTVWRTNKNFPTVQERCLGYT